MVANMKKFIGKLTLFLVLLALVVLPVNVGVDPYNIFHAGSIRDNGVEPNKNFIKTQFVLAHQDEYDSYLFGSSRAGFIDVSKLPDGRWYNLSYSEGLPAEQYQTLLALIDGGEIPKQVYLSVDNISFLVDPATHSDQLYRIAYPYSGSVKEKVQFYGKYLDTITTLESLKVIENHKGDTDELRQRLYSTGNEKLNQEIIFDENNKEAYWSDYYKPRTDEAIAEIEQLVKLCREYDIKLTVFTNPLYVSTYERSVGKGYLDFLEALAHVTPFYNFSGYNKISMDSSYYFETSHFTPEAADIMMETISMNTDRSEEYGGYFGFLVKEDNLQEFMDYLRTQAYVTGALDH